MGIVIVSIVIAVIATTAITHLSSSNIPIGHTEVQRKETTYQSQDVPPPAPLTALWGPQVSSFDQAKLITGLSTASLPSYIPADLTIGSIRASGSLIGVDLIPKNMTSQEDDTIEKVMGNGGIIIIYSKESPSFNQTAWVRNFSNQMTQEHQVGEINGHPSITVSAEKSAVFVLHPGEMVDIESVKYDSVELKKIGQSILP